MEKLLMNNVYCLDVIDGLKQLDDCYFDVIIVDPPYNIGKDFGVCKDNLSLEEYIQFSDLWVNECIRVLSNTGTMFIYGFSEILSYIFVRLQLNKRWLVWHYTNKNVASLNFWQRSHESIICAWKDKNIFNKDDVREKYTENFLANAAGKTRKNTKGRFGNKTTKYNAHAQGALPRDVIKIPALAGGAGLKERISYCKTCNSIFYSKNKNNHNNHEIITHPTQKPLELTKKLLLSAKPNNDTNVLIPFVGTGSECLASKQLKMNYIGFDNNEDYINMARLLLA